MLFDEVLKEEDINIKPDLSLLLPKIKIENLHHALFIPEGAADIESLLKLISNNNFIKYEVIPNENGNIVTEEIIKCISFAQNTSLEEQYKFAIIKNVCCLHKNAANALLKILEEPPKDTFFILTYTKKFALLPTIRSRGIFLFESPKNANTKITEVIENLINKDFTYLKFKHFYTTNHQKNYFKEECLAYLEQKINSLIGISNNKNLINFYYYFVFVKKYVKLYNTNLEVFLYYIIYTICKKFL